MPAERQAPATRHIHLDPIGGIAGDMFAAALVDALPELRSGLVTALDHAGLPAAVTVGIDAGRKGGLAGLSFKPSCSTPPPSAEGYPVLAERLAGLKVAPAVQEHAQAMLALLGEAEALVHGIALADVHFHELAGWDTAVDLMAAAWLIDALGPATWSVAPLPLGGGRIRTAHGLLPVPAPATSFLLEGFAWTEDGVSGERVTPTGAAILRHLAPIPRPAGTWRLVGTGHGLGTRDLAGVPNLLRALVLTSTKVADELAVDEIGVIRFEVDDQPAEDLALALDRLRTLPEVVDAHQWAVVGKRGRVGVAVQLLCEPMALDAVAAACLAETATIGLRQTVLQRRLLSRETVRDPAASPLVEVKRVRRPGGEVTAKAELRDIEAANETYAGRQRLRRRAERAALDEDP